MPEPLSEWPPVAPTDHHSDARPSRWGWIELACIAALGFAPAAANAYIDPGSGSLIFQSFLAILFGLGASWRRLRTLLRDLFARFSHHEPLDKG